MEKYFINGNLVNEQEFYEEFEAQNHAYFDEYFDAILSDYSGNIDDEVKIGTYGFTTNELFKLLSEDMQKEIMNEVYEAYQDEVLDELHLYDYFNVSVGNEINIFTIKESNESYFVNGEEVDEATFFYNFKAMTRAYFDENFEGFLEEENGTDYSEEDGCHRIIVGIEKFSASEVFELLPEHIQDVILAGYFDHYLNLQLENIGFYDEVEYIFDGGTYTFLIIPHDEEEEDFDRW